MKFCLCASQLSPGCIMSHDVFLDDLQTPGWLNYSSTPVCSYLHIIILITYLCELVQWTVICRLKALPIGHFCVLHIPMSRALLSTLEGCMGCLEPLLIAECCVSRKTSRLALDWLWVHVCVCVHFVCVLSNSRLSLCVCVCLVFVCAFFFSFFNVVSAGL